jgi:hypothetical protein
MMSDNQQENKPEENKPEEPRQDSQPKNMTKEDLLELHRRVIALGGGRPDAREFFRRGRQR